MRISCTILTLSLSFSSWITTSLATTSPYTPNPNANPLSNPLLPRLSCPESTTPCGTICIPATYTCCPDRLGGCAATETCQMGSNGEYGCCDIGRTCIGEGGSVWIDEKVNFQGGDGDNGSGGGNAEGSGTGEGEGGASPFGQEGSAVGSVVRKGGDGVLILVTGVAMAVVGLVGL